MAEPFDDIQLKILPAGTLGVLWSDVDRAVILINGKDIWEIVREEQEKNGRAEKFNYHQMRLCELYDYLVEAEQSNGKEETAILCCTCDEVGCGAVVTDIIKTPDKVIWQNIRDRDKATILCANCKKPPPGKNKKDREKYGRNLAERRRKRPFENRSSVA